jgi:hypothetical protein
LPQSSKETEKRDTADPGQPVGTDDEEGGLVRRPDEADRLRDAEHFAQPLQGEVGAVGELGLSDEPFEQAKARRDELAFVAGPLLDGDPDAWDAGVGTAARAPRRGPVCADGQERGARGRH